MSQPTISVFGSTHDFFNDKWSPPFLLKWNDLMDAIVQFKTKLQILQVIS